jgi:hypothetical protein
MSRSKEYPDSVTITIDLEEYLFKYAQELRKIGYTGDTYIYIGACKDLRDSLEKTYTSINPSYKYILPHKQNEPVTVTSRYVPLSIFKELRSKYGVIDRPSYLARYYKPPSRNPLFDPFNTVSSMYRPRPVDMASSSFPRSFSRISSRRQHMRINTVTVDPHTILESPYLLYILRRSMHHCFPSSYTNPDIDTMNQWNPLHPVVLFFTRIGGSETIPRMFIETEDIDVDTIKIVSMCSTHLGPFEVKKKPHFVKAAIHTWISEVNKTNNIEAELTANARDWNSIDQTNKMLNILMSKNGGNMSIVNKTRENDDISIQLKISRGTISNSSPEDIAISYLQYEKPSEDEEDEEEYEESLPVYTQSIATTSETATSSKKKKKKKKNKKRR